MKSRLPGLALVLLITAPHPAAAQPASGPQPWVENPELGEGEGLPLGALKLHPSLGAEFGYDSNYFRRGPGDLDADGNELPVLDTLLFRITPSLTLTTERQQPSKSAPPPVLRFRLDSGASAGYSIFIPLDETDEFDNRSRLGGGVGAGLELFPQRVVSWDLSAAYQRTIDPSSVASGDLDYDRHGLTAGTGVTWRPGGGLFEWRAGYRWRATYFSTDDYELFNNGQHVIETRGRWRFLPRTALLYDGSYTFIRYHETGSEQTQTDGEIIRSRLGVAGLLTSRFAFRALAGWGASFYEPRNNNDPQNFDGPIGNAEIKWFLGQARSDNPDSGWIRLSAIALGYEHDYAHSYLGPFYSIDRGYLTFQYFVGSRVVTSLQGFLARINYPEFVANVNGQTYSDVRETRLGARLFAEYRATSNIGINTTLTYDRNVSDDVFELAPDDPDNQSQDGLEYSRFRAFVGARVFW